MMIHEYRAKEILRGYGVPVPAGAVAQTAEAARAAAMKLVRKGCGYPVMVKAQVLAAARGKAGGVKLAKSAREVREAAASMLGADIAGETVRTVLVEEHMGVRGGICLRLSIDGARRQPVFLVGPASSPGIGQPGAAAFGRGHCVPVDPLLGLADFQLRELARLARLQGAAAAGLAHIARGVYRTFMDMDCLLVEINPLVQTPDGRTVAADAVLVFDDNALPRHPDIAALRHGCEEPANTRAAQEGALACVKLGGNIACIANGAGLAMATADLVKHFGGEPACFIDTGDPAGEAAVAEVLRLVAREPGVSAVFVNLFCGLARCDVVASGIIAAAHAMSNPNLPIVVRLSGTNEEIAREMVQAEALLVCAASMSEGADKAVQLAGRG